jgi:hypothetical protein
MTRPRPGVALSLLAGVALLACNSAASSSLTSSGTPNSQPTQTPAGQSAAAATPTAAGTTDVGLAGQNIANLTSYRAHITTPTGSADIVIIRQPTPAESFNTTDNGKTIRLIVIGSTDWIDDGTGTYIKNAIPATAATAMTTAFDPALIFSGFAKQAVLQYLTQVGTETKNGVSAVHFHGDQNTHGPNGATIPPGGMIDVWVSTSGDYLVALEATGMNPSSSTSGSFSIEITNINDPANAVNPPA